ncbi:peptidoglycan-binding protein [Streptomyces sp. LaPpAH-108]|uniref:peptidoglycan-binding protein n=1 Tax=Streptomyces sp. LaPpAH-108 TaxID=1155714 RepID=UPI00035EA6ED|nr:peptidoglycan-binding protein [Streptomyces sp. LaPpAH-108]
MIVPVFEEIEPVSDCDCPGCVLGRRTAPRPSSGGFPGRPAVRGAAVVAAAASAALGAVPQAVAQAGEHAPAGPARLVAPAGPARPGAPAADGTAATPQGGTAPLFGTGTSAAPASRSPALTRTQIINRAKLWVDAQVPYSTTRYWSDGYRQDCSGYVSMAWGLLSNEWTGSLAQFGVKITKDELEPGDILLFHNTADPQNGSHVVIFGGWTDYTRTAYTGYEQTPPHTRRQSTPYPYWNNTTKYVPYRYKNVTSGASGSEPATGGALTPFPGASYFGPGANNKYVTQLGQMLVARGGAAFYSTGPGPVWGEADRRATEAFQKAQGWTGSAADGLPGPRTWELLVTGAGKDIPPVKTGSVPAFPGRDYFRPGANNVYVTQLGQQLVKKGFGSYYATGPGPRWSEADRRAVEAFQKAQGWRGSQADGYPGPETWRRLFT